MTLIKNVSDTARWVAYYRAVESERPDALFHDPFARRLAGEFGEAISRQATYTTSVARAVVARTVVLDEFILDRIHNHGADLVIDLAAGLDARPWRMQLPPTLHWVDADLPGILGYKTDLLRNERTVCEYEAVPIDLTDAAATTMLFARLGAAFQRAVVITEGLLIYLEPDDVSRLGRALYQQESFKWWLTDLASPRLLEYTGRTRGKLLVNAPFRFGPAEGTAYFEPLGWHEVAFRSTIEECRRIGRPMPREWLFRIFSKFMPAARRAEILRMSGVVMFERTDNGVHP
jgi:methyltransferase (TIGR00027 family)